MDLDNMYTTKKGKDKELFIDVIKVPNITYPFTLMFYRGSKKCRRYKSSQRQEYVELAYVIKNCSSCEF